MWTVLTGLKQAEQPRRAASRVANAVFCRGRRYNDLANQGDCRLQVKYPPEVSQPRVSILLPVFNAAEFLQACLRSLERQTLNDFELIAVDDGSIDGSIEILREWGRSDGRLRVLERPHRGLVPSLNDGLALCRAPLVARMDADDIAHPRRLELQAEMLQARPEVAVVSCLIRHFPAHQVAQGFRLYDDWLNSLVDHDAMYRERFVESPVAHPSVMFRKRAVEEVGGYRDRGWPEDYDLWLRLFEQGSLFAKIPRILFFWRDDARRLSRTDPRYSSNAFLQCKAHFFARGPVAAGTTVILWGAGPNGKRLHRYLKEEGMDIKAVIDIDPAKIGRQVRGTPVVAPENLPDLLNDRTVVVAAVASRGARQLIRERLTGLGLHEGQDFWCLL